MPPVIDKKICTSCGLCENSCPLDIIFFNEDHQQPEIRYPEECWHCGSCRQDCPSGALTIQFPLRMMLPAGVLPY